MTVITVLKPRETEQTYEQPVHRVPPLSLLTTKPKPYKVLISSTRLKATSKTLQAHSTANARVQLSNGTLNFKPYSATYEVRYSEKRAQEEKEITELLEALLPWL